MHKQIDGAECQHRRRQPLRATADVAVSEVVASNYGVLGMTRHAKIRAQQRCIPSALIELVLRFGSAKHDKCHGERYFFDKRSRKRLRTYLGPWMYASVEERLGVFVVIADGMIVTCGWQTKPIRRN